MMAEISQLPQQGGRLLPAGLVRQADTSVGQQGIYNKMF